MMGLLDPNGGARVAPDKSPAGAAGCLLTIGAALVCWVLILLALVLAGVIARGVWNVLVLGWELVG